jgi:short-subunit dehydrogenase
MPSRFAIVTGASSGIGYELAKICTGNGFDLLIVADTPEIHAAAESLRRSENGGAWLSEEGALARRRE